MVRDWRASDYAVFTEAFDSVWGYEVSNDPENPSRRITAEVYVAGALMRSDFIKVAETEDGKPGVLLCAAFSDFPLPPASLTAQAQAWACVIQTGEEALSKTREGRAELVFDERLNAMNDRFKTRLEERGLAAQAELVFLIAHPEGRGQGLASEALAAFDEECVRRRVKRAVLFTDNHCERRPYLKKGWVQEETEVWPESEYGPNFVSFAFVKRYG